MNAMLSDNVVSKVFLADVGKPADSVESNNAANQPVFAPLIESRKDEASCY